MVVRVGEIVDDRRMRPSATARPGEDGFKVDGAIEMQAAVWEDIDPVSLVVTRCIEDRDLRQS